MDKNYQGVYIHIPFCKKKCYYCDFPSYEGLFTNLSQNYVDALCTEISASASLVSAPQTIFFGGGTPSLLKIEQFKRIVEVMQEKQIWVGDSQERTCEANPGTVDVEKLQALKDFGFNRLSLGVQSFSNEILKNIGRIHSTEQAIQTIKDAKEVGWQNISVDLMFGLPGQTLDMLKDSIKKAIYLGVQHISVYGLIVEEDTVLQQMIVEKKVFLPDEETEDAMYEFVNKYLPSCGFNRYEISNYCLQGFQSKHNMMYWQYLPYKGFGVAACSFDGDKRITNTFSVEKYIKDVFENNFFCEIENLSQEDKMAEFIFMGLRMKVGISIEEFSQRFKKDVFAIYDKQITEHIKNGYVVLEENYLKLTYKGMKIGNKIFMTFLI